MTYTVFFRDGEILVFSRPQGCGPEEVISYTKSLSDSTVVLIVKGSVKESVLRYTPPIRPQ